MRQFRYDYEQIQRNDIEVNQIDIELPTANDVSSGSRTRKDLEPRIEHKTEPSPIPVSDRDLAGHRSFHSKIQFEKQTQLPPIFRSSPKTGDLNENCEVMKKVHYEFL